MTVCSPASDWAKPQLGDREHPCSCCFPEALRGGRGLGFRARTTAPRAHLGCWPSKRPEHGEKTRSLKSQHQPWADRSPAPDQSLREARPSLPLGCATGLCPPPNLNSPLLPSPHPWNPQTPSAPQWSSLTLYLVFKVWVQSCWPAGCWRAEADVPELRSSACVTSILGTWQGLRKCLLKKGLGFQKVRTSSLFSISQGQCRT